MKDNFIKIILVIILIITALIIYYKSNPISFKNKISKTNYIEIYKYINDNYVLESKVDDSSTIKSFIDIFSSISFSKKTTILPLPEYKLILYDKKGDRITEINCFSGIYIKELNKNVTLNEEKYETLNKLIKSIMNN